MVIRQAVLADLDAVMAITGETIRIMQEENNPQWGEDYPAREDFWADILAGELYVYCDASEILGGLACLNEQEPEEYAPLAWTSTEPALVVHRLAVAPTMRRQGVASALMHQAEALAAERGLRVLKTDTYENNGKMLALFDKMGYHKVGEVHFGDRPGHFDCYEKRLA